MPGKTTLVRALLRGLGHGGSVKSPTYSLVEVYVISSLYLYHFDFIASSRRRISRCGMDEYFRDDSVCLVDGRRAQGCVPPPDRASSSIMRCRASRRSPGLTERGGMRNPSGFCNAAAPRAVRRRRPGLVPDAAGPGAAKLPAVLAVRIWPAADYTRVTLEHDAPLKFNHFLVENRIAWWSISGVEFDSVLDSLARKVTTDDPHIKLIRAGR